VVLIEGPTDPGGPGTDPQKPAPKKSAARQKCEAKAQQKYANARAAVPNITGRAVVIAMWTGIGFSGAPGCVAGGIAGATAGGVEGGPGGAAGGAIAGCADGALVAIAADSPQILVTTVAVGGATYVWENYEAKREFEDDMKTCSTIP
jgi:hypothetical protein